ncbi:MAG: tRNA (N6-isopentenyl adenosine(37)-C2)-methylthiotransferase MiaB [Lachnospiraceae bacterium]|nr:tRNA (N6-isopentenyl adenosine(37)-C2)-methylthiotransferase MiaB [Lachnospiraceae bacterium]
MSNTGETKIQLEYIEKLRAIIKEKSDIAGHTLKACVTTFGCQMNAKDSEKLSGILKESGYELVEDETDADMVIINTCTIRENANKKVYGHLGILHHMKKSNKDMKIAVCGCMMQEKTVVDKLKESYRYVDLIFGTHNIFKFAELLYRVHTEDDMIVDIWESTPEIVEDLPAVRKYSFKSGVNIMFGCNNFCTYCIVPYVRGRERSREPQDIIAEIERLVADGVVEVMLLGQNVNSYGKGLDEEITFAELLRRVEKVEGLERIRFMTSHPKDLSDELIEVMARSKKICRHLHLPLQSGSDKILKAMNRRYTKESYLDLVGKIRTRIPDIALSTDIIVGFPGETKEDVDDTIDVIEKSGFENAFTFIYSMRTGTPAADMEQCDPEFVKEQFDRVLNAVQKTARSKVGGLEGSVHGVLVEEKNEHEEGMMTGRMSNNVMVHFKGDDSLIGKIIDVRLTESKGFYYFGEKV